MKLARFATGWAVVELAGDAPERALGAAAEAGIRFWDAAVPEDFRLTLCVSYKDAAALCALTRRMGLDGRIVRAGGLPLLWKRVRRRRALLAALALCVLALTASRLFIWRVEIPDTAGLSESEIREALRECGVETGRFWPGFSQDLTRNALLRRLPQLRWATVNLRGGCAEVILRPVRQTPEREAEDVCANIVAARGGYVTRVEALRGEAAVVPGQTVLPGEVLIVGEAVGRYRSHGAERAIGTVQARTWYELSAAAPLEPLRAQRGRCVSTRWALIFGKIRINFYKGCSICPAACAKMTQETDLSVPGVFLLPLRIVRERVYECGTGAAPAADTADRLQEQLTQRLRSALGDEGELLQARFTQSAADGWLYVTMHAECSESIGVTVPMTAEQIASKSPVTEDSDE